LFSFFLFFFFFFNYFFSYFFFFLPAPGGGGRAPPGVLCYTLPYPLTPPVCIYVNNQHKTEHHINKVSEILKMDFHFLRFVNLWSVATGLWSEMRIWLDLTDLEKATFGWPLMILPGKIGLFVNENFNIQIIKWYNFWQNYTEFHYNKHKLRLYLEKATFGWPLMIIPGKIGLFVN
jgi:hypothetical protein